MEKKSKNAETLDGVGSRGRHIANATRLSLDGSQCKSTLR